MSASGSWQVGFQEKSPENFPVLSLNFPLQKIPETATAFSNILTAAFSNCLTVHVGPRRQERRSKDTIGIN